MTDSNLRDLERAWTESGSEEDCEAFLAAKVRAEGWPIRRVLELAMASLIDRKPTPAEVLLWIDTDCLPCNRAGCPNAASPALTYRPTGDRLCEECSTRRVLQTGRPTLQGGAGGEVRIIGGEGGTTGESRRRCLRRGCRQAIAAGRGASLFCTTSCESLSVIPYTHERVTPTPPTAPPGTHGPDDYGPDSFGGSDYEL